MVETAKIIRPQPGFQMKALSSPADIVIGGAAAGVGKTYTLLLEFLRHIDIAQWGGVIFRRTSPQIRNEGGLWDTSMTIYPGAGGIPKESSLEWQFKSGCKLKFSHLEYEKNMFDWQGSQIPFIGFDELTHFSEKMFFYLMSRNRSSCGIKPYVRATCNPDPESWVAKLVEWWIDQESGYPIPERNGVLRYFIKNGDDYIWGDSYEEVITKSWFFLEELVKASGIEAHEFVKSITFISGSIFDNKELLGVNPSYLANLLSQDEQTQNQLLKGNWKVIISDLDVYNYQSFLGVFDNVMNVSVGRKYITADIALDGSDKFVVGVWYNKELVDILIMDKSSGPEVIQGILRLARAHGVQNRNIAYDADGLGGFVGGYIEGAVAFKNNSTPLPSPLATGKDRDKPENYFNLKTQCYYRSGMSVENGSYKISDHVAVKMYDDRMTVKQRFMFERKAIKKAKKDDDGKLRIIKKEEMKTKLGGQSPDLMDMVMMREYFELQPKFSTAVA
jgi:hypothetical protein